MKKEKLAASHPFTLPAMTGSKLKPTCSPVVIRMNRL